MREYAGACWKTCEKLHLLMVDDDQPENEKQRFNKGSSIKDVGNVEGGRGL